MRLNPRIFSSAAAIVLTCVVSAAAYYYKSLNREINVVMVFCKLQFNAYNSFDKLISYVEAARKSVDVCMPSIHNPAIQNRLLQVMLNRGVKARIIIDRNGYNYSTEFLLKELLDAGAEIKCRATGPFNMQHKFCLVDGKVLMTGTLNWGDDRTSDGWNYVYITSKPQLVLPVKVEFNQMWYTYTSLEDAFQMESAYESDEETPEIKPEDITDQNEILNKPPDVPLLRETLLTPELCIMLYLKKIF